MPSVAAYVQRIIAVAKVFKLPVMTYEAGQALVITNVMQYQTSPNSSLTNLFIATIRDVGMAHLYQLYVNSLISIGAVSSDFPLMSFAPCGP